MDIKSHGLRVFTPAQIFSRITPFIYTIALALSFVFAGISLSYAPVLAQTYAPVLAQSNALPLAAATLDKIAYAPELSKLMTNNPGGRYRMIIQYSPSDLGDVQSLPAEQKDEVQISRNHAAQNDIIAGMFGGVESVISGPLSDTYNIQRMDYSPMLVMDLTAAEIDQMAARADVTRIQPDIAVPLTLSQSTVQVNMAPVWNAGGTGTGRTIAILDSGVKKSHEFITITRVVSEACYNTTNSASGSTSRCPGGASSSIASGSGADCNPSFASPCGHGTHVAGIAAGFNTGFSLGEPIFGMAPQASIIAINIASKVNDALVPFASDVVRGLERVYALRTVYNIDAANLSLGGGEFFSACDSNSSASIIGLLRTAGIATVISAGNNGFNSSVNAPGCVSDAITVASSLDNSDTRSSFSNWGNLIDVVAPGSSILSSEYGSIIFNSAYGNRSGTSMAAPHVTGAFAALRSLYPTATVSQIEAALENTGTPITSAGVTKPRINMGNACAALGSACGATGGPPGNDNFANAFTIPGGASSSGAGTNLSATGETGEPEHDTGNATPLNSVWWKFTATQNGPLEINTNGSSFNTILAVYTGSAVNALTKIVSDNDSGTGQDSLVTFNTTAGTTYYVAVEGFQSATGTFAWAFTIPPPANDNFANAITIPAGTSGSGTGTNVGATGETGEPEHDNTNASPLNSVWWKFTAAQSGSLEFDTDGSDFDTILAVYTGSAVNALTKIVSDDNGGSGNQSLVTFNTTAGTTYYVAVEGYLSATGTIAWAYTFTGGGPSGPAIVASILPTARATQVNGTVTAFATILNFGNATATGCSIALPGPIAGTTFLYQTTDGSNVPIGTPNAPVNIPASSIQGFYFAITATAAFSQNINLVFDCTNTDPVTVIWGVNTFSMTASTGPIADMVSIAATIGNTGYIVIPTTTGQQIATTATINIGSTRTIIASVTEQAVGGPVPNMPATLLICPTDIAGNCIIPFTAAVSFTAVTNVTHYFTIRATGTGTVANDPAMNRAHLYFRDGANVVGSTSVAVRTAP